ncbi:hypothetical protein MCEMSEM29_00086 [Methylophilaceae bacterium]
MNAKLLKSCTGLTIHLMLLGSMSQAAQAAKLVSPAKQNTRQAVGPQVDSVAKPAQVKLAQLNGNVLVNTGTAYRQAVPEQVLNTGAKIITTQGASVSVRYADGCVKTLPQNTMLTIGAQSECISNSFKERVYVAEAIGEQAVNLSPDVLPSTVSTASASIPATVSAISAVQAFTLTLLTTVATTADDNPTISSE